MRLRPKCYRTSTAAAVKEGGDGGCKKEASPDSASCHDRGYAGFRGLVLVSFIWNLLHMLLCVSVWLARHVFAQMLRRKTPPSRVARHAVRMLGQLAR